MPSITADHFLKIFFSFVLQKSDITSSFYFLLLVSLPLFLRTVILLLGAVIKYLWNISDR